MNEQSKTQAAAVVVAVPDPTNLAAPVPDAVALQPPGPALPTPSVRPSPLTITIWTFIVAGVVVATVFSTTKGGQGIGFAGLTNVAQTLAPLVAVAAFIERAVEIVISTWRDAGGSALSGPSLEAYKLQTRSYAYMASLSLSLCASIVGVRGLSSLVKTLVVASSRQQFWFTMFDVILTALLLSGGSDAVHQVVTTITNFLDNTKAKTNAGP
jgi:hypothetical protein